MRTAVLVVEIYAAFVVLVATVFAAAIIREAVSEHLQGRLDRRRWSEIDAEADAFRAELDRADWQEELRHYGRAA